MRVLSTRAVIVQNHCPLWRLRVKHDAQSAAETCSHLYLSYDGYALTHAGD
jgi:hypothetical protein